MAARRRCGMVCGFALVAAAGGGAGAASLDDLVSFRSAGGRLDLIMTALPAPVDFGGVGTTGWVYEVCRRASAAATSCLPGTAVRPYGGVRLRLRRNDTLNIRLVNRLPPVADAEHCKDNPDLANNPTNLHTHGLIVEPHRSTGAADPYGDYVFVAVRNPDNAGACAPAASGEAAAGAPAADTPPHVGHAHGNGAAGGAHPDMDVAERAVEYSIKLVNHPSGLFWFHPHMHGLSVNQVTAGMAGVITVGGPADECGGDRGCEAALRASTERVLVLKDSEVLADGTLLNQQDAGFCPATAAEGEAPRRGVCAGDAAAGFEGGRWFHTINGQVYPEIGVGRHGGLWRIVNASASRSYDLSLAPEGGGGALPLQVLSIDGIMVDAAVAENLPALQAQLGAKAEVFRCPDPPGARRGDAVCTRRVRIMPSARVTLRVLNERPVARKAVLRTDHYPTGPDADDWPAIDLASVSLAPPAPGIPTAVRIPGGVRRVLSPSGALGAPPSLSVPGAERPEPLDQAQQQRPARPDAARPVPGRATEFAIDPALKLGLRQDPACANLGPGERRRVYFGNPTPGRDGFGLATAVVGADGQEKPGTATPMRAFDPTQTSVCLTASRARGRPTTETWEVFNITGEDHNFHVHQTRFWLLPADAARPGHVDTAAVLQDNVPLPHAADVTGCDGSLERFQSGACKPTPVVLRVPFTQVGDFVFHCHILEHEDGGMMARIRVVAPPPVSRAAR